jgi:two-component system heavy metal sensor histidine kinase CusS
MSFADRRSPLASLSSRFTLASFVFASALVLVLMSILALDTWRTLVWQEEQVLLQRTEALYSWLSVDVVDEDNLYHEIIENVFAPREILMRVEDPALSEPLESPDFSSSLNYVPSAPPMEPSGPEVGFVFDGDSVLHVMVRTVRRIGEGDRARLVTVLGASNLTLDERAFAGYLRRALALTALLITGSALLLFLISRWLLRPLQRITSETARVDPNTLDLRISVQGLPSELAILADAHNRMLDRLVSAYRSLSAYADNAAHELRGPVGRMMLKTEVALSRNDLASDHREDLESLYDDASRLREVLNSVLFLARSENGIVTLARSQVDVSQTLQDLGALYAPVAEDGGIDLVIDCAAGLVWPLDSSLFQQAVSNVMENALHHSRTGGRVRVTARQSGNSLCLSVEDTGVGILPEHLPHVFDRFFRADQVRGPGTGNGLGLAIVQSIVRLHGGSADIESDTSWGTKVQLRFG